MAIITCPECGQHPVSDRAAACPRCGCPIGAVHVPVAPVPPSGDSSNKPPTIREERDGRLLNLGGAFVISSSEFPDASVQIFELTNLSKIVDDIQDWCEELIISDEVKKSHIDKIAQIKNLRSIESYTSKLDDESILRISKLRTLLKLKFTVNEGRTSEIGWLQLARLNQLEYLQIPMSPFSPSNYDLDKEQQLKQQLQRLFPRTIIA